MIVPLDLALFVVLILTAWLALHVKDLLAAVALLASYSLFAALLFAGLLALDVALVEAALGAGLTGVLFISAIHVTTRRSDPRPIRNRRWVVLPLILAFSGLVLFASTDLPDRGDPEAPAQLGVSTAYIEGSLEQTQTPNVVTSLLADYRGHDTLGETLVILTAALAASLVLARRPDQPDEGEPKGPSPEEAHVRADGSPHAHDPEASDGASEGDDPDDGEVMRP